MVMSPLGWMQNRFALHPQTLCHAPIAPALSNINLHDPPAAGQSMRNGTACAAPALPGARKH